MLRKIPNSKYLGAMVRPSLLETLQRVSAEGCLRLRCCMSQYQIKSNDKVVNKVTGFNVSVEKYSS